MSLEKKVTVQWVFSTIMLILQVFWLNMDILARLSDFQWTAPDTELTELSLSLLAKIAAVHEEQDSPSIGMFDESVNEIGGGECLAAAGCHLDQRARPGECERLFEIFDGLNLGLPQAIGYERRHGAKLAA